MVYELDRKFIRKEILSITSISLILITMGGWFTYSMVLKKDWMFLGGVYLVYIGFNHLKTLKYWKSNKIKLQINNDCLSVSDVKETKSLKIKNIDKVVIQLKYGNIKSIILHTPDNMFKLQGFNAMDEISEQLKGLLDESKIKTAKIFHR